MLIPRLMVLLGLILFVGACTGPQNLPSGPTPIPTLIPATEPAGSLDATPGPSFAILSYPAGLPSAEKGKPLYDTHCARCHGEDGRGTVPGARNFNDVDYMRGETPASFYAAITEGRGEMSGFRNQMTSDERWDVVFYVWRFSTSRDILARGEEIYEENCVACHGADGTDEVLGSADFTDVPLVGDEAPRDFYLVVTQGEGSMPAWQGRLSQEERWAVIDYLLTFAYDPALPEGEAAAPSPTPVEEAGCDPSYLSQSNPFAWDDEEAIEAGRITYGEACDMCHAADGSGALPNARDFTTAEKQNDLRSNPGEYLCITAEGRQNMPGWKETLTTEEMWQVLTYMGTFGE